MKEAAAMNAALFPMLQDSTAWLVGGGVSLLTAVIGLIRYWLRLRFLRHVYDRNGDRRDLKVAGEASRSGWLRPTRREEERLGPGQDRDAPPGPAADDHEAERWSNARGHSGYA
jgi:hypothetical protein